MAITEKISSTTAAVSGATTEFTVTGAFWLFGSGFGFGESASIEGLGPDGAYRPATNASGPIGVTANPNTVYCDLPAGTYRIKKTSTALAASVGYEVAT